MSDARAALVSRAIYIRSFMERSRGDIKQWSWVWEKEIQNIEVTLAIYHFKLWALSNYLFTSRVIISSFSFICNTFCFCLSQVCALAMSSLCQVPNML